MKTVKLLWHDTQLSEWREILKSLRDKYNIGFCWVPDIESNEIADKHGSTNLSDLEKDGETIL